jgi:hypothetical protein
MIASSSAIETSNDEDKENVCPDGNMDWLHRNHNYVRTVPTSYDNSCVTNNLSAHTLINARATTPGDIRVFLLLC